MDDRFELVVLYARLVAAVKRRITRAKTMMLEWFQEDYDYARFDEVLSSRDGDIIKGIVDYMMPERYERSMLESKVLEKAYLAAQRQGVTVSGWKLRFLLYYFYGRNCGDW